jgi:hypothetical protein
MFTPSAMIALTRPMLKIVSAVFHDCTKPVPMNRQRHQSEQKQRTGVGCLGGRSGCGDGSLGAHIDFPFMMPVGRNRSTISRIPKLTANL